MALVTGGRRIMTIATRSTAIAAFGARREAEQAVIALLEEGFEPDRLGIVLPDAAACAVPSGEADPPSVWVGRMFRRLIGAEISEAEIRYYEEALEGDHTLVMVRAADRYPLAMAVLESRGGQYMAAF
jgi:hypothetical protein